MPELQSLLSSNVPEVCDGNHVVVIDNHPPAYIVSEEGDSILVIQRAQRVILPLVQYDNEAAVKDRINALLWASVIDRNVPMVSESVALGELRRQLAPLELETLYCGPGVPADFARKAGVSVVEMSEPDSQAHAMTVLGLPAPEHLGYNPRVGDRQGLVVFGSRVAAVRLLVVV